MESQTPQPPTDPHDPANVIGVPPPPPAPPPPPGVHPCGIAEEDPAWVDWVQSRVFQLTCISAWWFDGLFSPRRHFLEYRESSGMLIVGSNWDQIGGFDPQLRFRARVNLPETKGKLNAFVGRGDERELVAEATPDTYALPASFARRDDDKVFLGLGFRDDLSRRGSFDADAGVRLTFPVDPYVKGSYRFARPIGETNLLRLRETVFWQNSQGFGTTGLVEFNHLLDEKLLLRSTTTGTFSEATVGLRWYSELMLYQLLSNRRALAYQATISGSTDLPERLSDYGGALIYRHKIHREWLFVETRAGISWPKYDPFTKRTSNLNAGLAIEMRFGNQ